MKRNIHYIYNIALLLLLGAATPLAAQTIRGKIYGGGQLATVDGDTKVQINSGTIGDGEAFDGGVFGGGLGEPTVVTGDVKVNIGKSNSVKDAAGPTINGDVYGGSALGNTNCSSGLVATPEKTTQVALNAGTINGSMYGGALGQKNGIDGATKDVAANVYGPVQVGVNGGIVLRREGDDGGTYSGGIYGCNNFNGSPQSSVDVDIWHHNTAKPIEDKYTLFAVYGGGNQADYVAGTPNVKVHYCENRINYVYGGGNAAHLTHETDGNTNVTIWGCELIGNVFGGGNGQVNAANVSGNTQVTIHGGTIENVYGGSNTNGMIGGVTKVDVLAQAEPDIDPSCTNTMNIENVYGGGNKAAGKSGTVNIACTGDEGYIANVYGGANMADLTGDITLNIKGGQITNVFGGNNTSGRINGAITVNVDWATGDDACGNNSLVNVYGGGNLAPYYAYGYDVVDGVWTEKSVDPDAPITYGPIVNLKNGTVSNNVYGGGLGEAAVVTGNPQVNLIGATVTNDIFGGGDAAPVVGNPLVNANYGTVKDIFAGGRGETAVVTGDPLAKIKQTTDKVLNVTEAVYGGGDAANVVGTAGVQMLAGNVKDIYGGGNAADVTNTDVIIEGGISERVFGGGHGNKGNDDPENPAAAAAANVTDNANVLVKGGTINQVFAAGNSLGSVDGVARLTINKDNSADDLHIIEAYGGGNEADGNAGIVSVLCTGGAGESVGDVYGGARNAIVTGDITLNLQGGTIIRAFGGNNVDGNVTGKITVNVNHEGDGCDLDLGSVYGGGNMAPYAPTEPGAYPEVNIINGTVNHDVFGGGLGKTAIVTSNPVVTVTGGKVIDDVYGGGALADVRGNTTVNLFGGSVGGAYGGGLGQLASEAVGNVDDPGYIPAKEAIAAIVTGNTNVTLGKKNDDNTYSSSQVTTTGIFGANNLNGTPQGHVKVHVLSTTDAGNGAAYHVPAVYGGGNLSAYQPSDEKDFAEVLIENCDNSIEYVYGGGNAAPVPATKVTIYGANAINHAFAGGNGAGQSTDPDKANYNPGADVGYLDFTRDDTHAYGTGKASITVYGGTVHNVYGGSNTLGFIRGGTSVSVANEDGACPLNVGNVFGGGNEADINCDVTMDLDCSEGGTILYAGANNADVNGSITLNIHSGTYGKVFCGNNTGGAVKGKLTVNVDETGCWPIMIGELYGGGNQAGYSVYGYKVDGEGKTLREDGNVVVKTGGDRLYGDPEVNLYSFTRIGKVFGGGYGETAVLYGNTHVNVEPIPGIYSDGTAKPAFVLNQDDERVRNDANSTVADVLGAEKIGSIGTIYGGGNAGAVYGNTEVKIGTNATNKHIPSSALDKLSDELKGDLDVAVTITGDVFGGGNEAIVTGDTHVTIGK